MNALLYLPDDELMEAAELTNLEFDELENQLALRAAVLHWSGDPMRQPLDVVASIVRQIIRMRGM